MDIIRKITESLGVRRTQVEAAVRLIDEGNTIPFIARYRKEATGELHDDQLRTLGEQLAYLRGLEERRETVLSSIEEQGKLTPELRAEIEAAETLVALEDLYLPYRPKRRTRAGIAKERGLEPLASLILLQQADRPLQELAAPYVNPEKEVPDAEAAVSGARDIIAESLSDSAEHRGWIRDLTWNRGLIVTSEKKETARAKKASSGEAEDGAAKAKAKSAPDTGKAGRRAVYEMYFDFSEPIAKLPGHRTLAINRGEAEKYLTVKLEAPEEEIVQRLTAMTLTPAGEKNPYTRPAIEEAAKDAYDRLIAPAIERELRNRLTEEAEEGAMKVFKSNLEQLLMQQPVAGKTVLGWDPAFRTGCKLAVVDPTGKVLDTTVIYPTAPQNKVEESLRTLKALIKKYNIDLISLGNGTASRESEQVITRLIKELDRPLSYAIVNEAGASVYSASALGTEEFPGFDVGQRSAASMARRLQDPLSELVKVDPKAIGVGQYQHDMNEKRLAETLGGVVEDCVNRVGVDVNTASFSLLSYVSGITSSLAKNIVAYREANGRFRNRRELLKVAKLGPKAFEQCAGFLRIAGGTEPLDATAVHPESYDAVRTLFAELKVSDDLTSFALVPALVRDKKRTAERIGIGEITLADILKELAAPGRDPREDAPAPVLRHDVLSMEDLVPGMKLKGTVRNIVDFGAFVDIGVHQDGLVHISRLSDRFIRHPLEVVKVGDVVDVTVVSVDPAKKRIALSMNGKN